MFVSRCTLTPISDPTTDAAAAASAGISPGPPTSGPALPKAWPDGEVTGLRARGGFTVDIKWRDGAVADYRITSATPRQVRVLVNRETKTITSTAAK